MSIIEERRTEVRADNTTYRIAIATRRDDDRAEPGTRVMLTLEAGDPDADPVAEGSLDLDLAVAARVADLVAEGLRTVAGPGRSRRGSPTAPARQGSPWTEEMDADLEARWLAGESVAEIAAHFERSPGGIRARLPRVGCDPERPGSYLPVPPSRRTAEEGAEPA